MSQNTVPGLEAVTLAEAHLPGDLVYRSLFEYAPVEVHIWALVRDENGAIVTWRLVDANAIALKAWGRQREEVVGKTTDEIFPGADAVRMFLPTIQEIMTTGKPKHWEVPFSGTAQVLRMASIPVGECFISTGFDVSQEQARQAQLEQALQSVTEATKAGGVGLWDWDLRTNEVRYSDEWKRQLGYAPDEIGNSFEEWRSRLHPDDIEPALARVRAAIDDPRRLYDVVFRLRHKDGSYRSILGQGSVLRDEAGHPQRMVGSQIDITERRRLEEKALEAQKLESLGTLAAGIAHDFNNLLFAIAGNLSLLRDTPADSPEGPVLLKAIEDATGRATALTKQLLTFSKGGSPVRALASIGELLVDSATFVARGSKAQCEFDVAADLMAVNADAGQLSQVIGNLVINAIQAMPQGGTVRISASNVALPHNDPTGLPAGPYVQITVADEGCGISPENLARIFDPFFTTKPTGSGLGLSMSYSIIVRHGGRITAASELGRGTAFTVLLPASDAAPRAAAKKEAVTGRGRILVMDDDETICGILQRMLGRLGYAADTCQSGEDALTRYQAAQQAHQAYDAIILDLTVPGHVGGAQVLPLLKAMDPEVVAIVSSGYSNDDAIAHFETHGFRGRLTKPYDMASLSIELDRVLH